MIQRRFRLSVAVAGAAAVLVAAAGCGGSSSDGSGGDAGAQGGKTYTIGVLADITGPAASGNETSVEGVKAGTYYAEREGIKIKYIVADTATNPTTALSAAQKLVTQDHVFAVIAHSALAFAAAPYLTAQKIPVIGMPEDGPEWNTSENMFGITGLYPTGDVTTTTGEIFKKLGATTIAAIGYAVSPGSQVAAGLAAESAKAVGLKVGYLNTQLPFGGTDVGPVVLAMKEAGIDGFTAAVDPNTAFALIKGLRQQGVEIKAAMLATGYGGDLVQAGPGALNDAQGVYFSLAYQPVEMKTAATKQFQADLESAGVTDEPTFAQYNGYTSVGLLVRGLKAAGANPTQASLITALTGIHDWDGLGMFGYKLDINASEFGADGKGECLYIAKLEGDAFEPVQGALPLCGRVVPGRKVQPSS
ncbi:ABC-type branched-chain amino acid transport systems periplasmic component-like protein [Parafrankia sp. EAN1pec]|uniref:ABC transporter substrate-binding protein n=1 Tax=Parafrankia sp. (strain EAN1pec) TaxID=298653 RepID=UPI0000542907|nr:ABC-type branched-chain amino acid transport systems periplasmic component-like protein [Frankia sp. EAN1pec]